MLVTIHTDVRIYIHAQMAFMCMGVVSLLSYTFLAVLMHSCVPLGGCWWPGSKSDDYKAIAMGWQGLTSREGSEEKKSDTPYHQQTALTDY